MRHLISISAALAAAALVLPATAGAASQQKQETASSGTVSATLDYTVVSNFEARNVKLSITRAGAAALTGDDVSRACGECDGSVPLGVASGEPNGSLTVRDLDGDGEPEVLVDLYTGGAHCCTVSVLYHFDAASGKYTRIVHRWGDPAYRLSDLDGDGKPEFLTSDDRFAYSFCAYACSALPGVVLRYQGGRLVDVTKTYPARIRKEAASLLAGFNDARKSKTVRFEGKGILPAYCADEYLLGRGSACQKLLRAALKRGDLAASGADLAPSGKKYVTALNAFLRKLRYR